MNGFLRSVLLLSGSIIFFHVLAVLFGARLLANVKETFIFGTVLALCSTAPSIIVIHSWEDFFRIHFDSEFHSNKERTVAILAKTSIFGAWIGAFPIPLDWDRWWQEWPITCVVGCILGFTLGFIYTRLLVFRRPRQSKLLDFKPKTV